MGTFVYTPGEGDPYYRDDNAPRYARPEDRAELSIIATQQLLARAMTWQPPTGHASWCYTQSPPEWRTRHSVYGPQGRTPMASPGCNCAKSQTARHLRKLAAIQGDSAVGVAA